MMTPPNADQSFMQALMRRRMGMGGMQPGGSSAPPQNWGMIGSGTGGSIGPGMSSGQISLPTNPAPPMMMPPPDSNGGNVNPVNPGASVSAGIPIQSHGLVASAPMAPQSQGVKTPMSGTDPYVASLLARMGLGGGMRQPT